MNFAVILFPGSNCATDMYHAIKDVLGHSVDYVWSSDTSLDAYDVIVLPGGFSYGDYLRCGAMAAISNVVPAIRRAAEQGKTIIGICNGFQILTEMGLLPGGLLLNQNRKFLCQTEQLVVANTHTRFTSQYTQGQVIDIPIAHGEGRYYADDETLAQLQANGQIVFTYADNPNGSQADIAGITNQAGNVLCMMPHPERAVEALLGSIDGLGVFHSIMTNKKEYA